MVSDRDGGGDILDVSARWDEDDQPPTFAIIETISNLENVDPVDLDFQLNDYVDADALNRLLRTHKDGDIEVDLQVNGHVVTIRGDGRLRVRTAQKA